MEKKKTPFFRLWLPVVFWAGLIFIGSSLPAVKTGADYWPDFLIKKVFHLFEYFILYLLTWRAFKNYFSKQVFIVAFLFIVLYAASDEFHQSFVPGREAKVRDVIIDAAGGFLGLWFLKSLPRTTILR